MMKRNEQTETRFFKICIYVILGVTLIYFVAWQLTHPRNATIDNNAVFLDGFETTDADGETVIVKPDTRYAFVDGVFETRKKLPEILRDDILCIFSFSDLDVYCGDRLIYQNRLYSEPPIIGGAVNGIHHFVNLDESCAGQTVRILQYQGPEATCLASKVILGTGSEIYRLMFREYGPLFIMGLFVLAIAGVLIIFGLVMQHHNRQPAGIVTISIAVFVTAGWIVTESYFYPFVFMHNFIDGLMSYFLCMLLPSPYIFYLSSLQKGRYRKTYRALHIIVLASFVVCTGLHFTGICRFYQALPYIDFMLAGMIFMFTVIMFNEFRHGYVKSYRYTAMGLSCFMLAAIVEILLVLVSNREQIGGLVMISMMFLLGFAVAQQMEDSQILQLERQKALELSETKTAFMANMSHEIRTPINSILGMNEMILRESREPETLAYAGTIQRSGKMLLSLINDVLDFSRIEAGKLEIVKDEYRTSELLADIATIAGEQAEQKGLKFEMEIADGIPAGMYSDEVRIKQILLNLLSNAVKYTDKGTVTLTAGGQFTDDETYDLIFTVKDTGRGIREEDIGNLFQAFSRNDLRKNRNIEGTGLGLAIVKSITDGLGGTVKVESEYQKGSVFTVTLPQHVTDHTKTPVTLSAMKEAGIRKAASRAYVAPEAKILAVDDNQPNLMIVRAFLKDIRAQVDLCSNGKEALVRCRATRYDLILLDHMMPEPDGIQTLHLIREDPGGLNHDTTAVVLTANAVAGIRKTYLDAGFADYLTKPMTVERLQEAVRWYLPEEKVLEPEEADGVYEFEAAPAEDAGSASAHSLEIPGLDMDEALKNTGGSTELLAEVLNDIVQGAAQKTEDIRKSAAEKDLERYRLTAHTLKGLTATVGAKEMSEQARKHEYAARDGDVDFILENYEAFASDYAAFAAKIRTALRKEKT